MMRMNMKRDDMKSKNLISLLTAVSLIFATVGNAIACTTLMVMDANGNAYHARTNEFSGLLPEGMTYFPAGTKIESVAPSGKQGLTFNTKYAMLGISINVLPNIKQTTLFDGANDQGLSFSGNWLTNSNSPPVGKDPSKILSSADFGAWVLGNFKTVAEVKAAVLSDETEFWLPPVPSMGNIPVPFHYAVFDKKGGALVIQFINGKKNVYDNPVNALTNGPAFPWHLENLNNYIFTNQDKNTGQLGKLKLATEDAGNALMFLPSAETSQGRFVKAAFYANYVKKAKTQDDAVITLGHIMNNFDRPYNLTVDAPGGTGDGVRGQTANSEVTAFTTMYDGSRNLMYFRTINALNWSVLDINKLKGVTKSKTVSIYDINKAGADSYNLFYK